MKLEWFNLSILLALTYSVYIVLSQYLISMFNISPQAIFTNVILIAAAICLFSTPQYIMKPQFNTQYGLLILIGVVLYFQNLLLQLGTKSPVNMGIIDGLAIGIYLPLMTFLLYCCFGEVVTKRKAFGILLACFAAFFILT